MVAISPDVAEEPGLVENIKTLLTRASAALYSATRQRAFLRSVRILVPRTWTGEYGAVAATAESQETAEVVVAAAHPAYGESPFTVQYGECGQPGEHVHLTPFFLTHLVIFWQIL